MTSPWIGGLWEDLRIASSARTTGPNPATLEVFRDTLRAWRFDNGASIKELFFSAQVPHAYKQGTDLKLHIHWGHASAADNGAVVWQCEYAWANNLSSMPASTTTAATAANVLAADQYKPMVTPIATLTGTGKEVSSLLLLRLFRDPANAGDTSTANVFMLELDLHYQSDTVGSIAEMNKP